MYEAKTTGTCPHCGKAVRFERGEVFSGSVLRGTNLQFRPYDGTELIATFSSCPACGKPIIYAEATVLPNRVQIPVQHLLWPVDDHRPVPEEVEDESPEIASDFSEAVAVYPRSGKAAAALARRCVQHILTEKAGTSSSNLSTQIDEVIGDLPSHIATNVDAIRQIGNFAAHPKKATSTGEIVDVEEGEAEWLLDVLEDLFDFYYVQPARSLERRERLNKKLEDIGKPPLKAPESREADADA